MTHLIFKSDKGIIETVKVQIIQVEPALFDSEENVLYCSSSEFKHIEDRHKRGESYRQIINSVDRFEDIKIYLA